MDTLNLLFDKLQYIFSGYNTIRESFLGLFDLYKQGKILDREFFEKLHESINRFSALEFLLIKAMFEIKKTLNRSERRDMKGYSSSSSGASLSGPSIASFITPGILPQAKSLMNTSQLEDNMCPNCGVIARKTASFCTNCGFNRSKQPKI